MSGSKCYAVVGLDYDGGMVVDSVWTSEEDAIVRMEDVASDDEEMDWDVFETEFVA